MRTEPGQALVEMVLGMLALAMVVSALCGFAVYIARSLELQNAARRDGGRANAEESVSVGIYFGGTTIDKLKILQMVEMPPGSIER